MDRTPRAPSPTTSPDRPATDHGGRRSHTGWRVLPVVTILVSLAVLAGALPALARTSSIAFASLTPPAPTATPLATPSPTPAGSTPAAVSSASATPTPDLTPMPSVAPTPTLAPWPSVAPTASPVAATLRPAPAIRVPTPTATPRPTRAPESPPTPTATPKPIPTPKPIATPTPAAPSPVATPTPVAPTYAGTNHVWIPALGVNRPVYEFPCSRSQEPDNLVYTWGCAGTNNVYLLGHAYGVFLPLYDAYYNGKLKVGLKVVYADGAGTVHTYSVVWWKVVLPTTDASWAWAALPAPGMTLQTCVGSNSQYRLMVRLDEVG